MQNTFGTAHIVNIAVDVRIPGMSARRGCTAALLWDHGLVLSRPLSSSLRLRPLTSIWHCINKMHISFTRISILLTCLAVSAWVQRTATYSWFCANALIFRTTGYFAQKFGRRIIFVIQLHRSTRKFVSRKILCTLHPFWRRSLYPRTLPQFNVKQSVYCFKYKATTMRLLVSRHSVLRASTPAGGCCHYSLTFLPQPRE